MPKPYHTPRSERDDARGDLLEREGAREMSCPVGHCDAPCADCADTFEHAGNTELCPDGHCDEPGCSCNRGAILTGARALRAAEDLAVREQSADWDRDDARDEQMESLGEYPMFHEEN